MSFESWEKWGISIKTLHEKEISITKIICISYCHAYLHHTLLIYYYTNISIIIINHFTLG